MIKVQQHLILTGGTKFTRYNNKNRLSDRQNIYVVVVIVED